MLKNSILRATFDARGLASLTLLLSAAVIQVQDDNFALGLGGTILSSASLPNPTKTALAFRYTSGEHGLSIDVAYSLGPSDSFVTKSLTVTSSNSTYNITNVTLFHATLLTLGGAPFAASTVASSHFGMKDYALFARWPDAAAGVGAMLTARNPFLSALGSAGRASLSYAPMALLQSGGLYAADPAHLGLHALTGRTLRPPAPALDEAEHAAMVACVRAAMSAPMASRPRSVKINIGWCENDFQIDIATAEGRAEYKRIIDRAAELGLEQLLFAPRNSEVSSRANNSDAWGWEQLLWFGMGQRLRTGRWAPGDPLPPSLLEMLAHFRLRGVRPVAYVYPILAFLAGALPGGASPPWIVNGTYLAAATSTASPASSPAAAAPRAAAALLRSGPLRSDLASPALQRWLPDTLLAFANATGAGGFSFDYTYFEQGAPGGRPWESQLLQWAGWRTILARLQVERGCAGQQCVVDNRQANHAWGPWMWAQGGTYAEPLQSDEQPGSWMFYEADLHTDRLSANRQRETAWSYRLDEFAPAELVPGFALHQTDRDVSRAEARVPCAAGVGRCAAASRRRDFDLLGYRYSLLAAVGTGGANLVLNMLPARDPAEYRAFPPEDIAFVRRWLAWTDAHRDLVLATRALPRHGKPAAGALDGTAMLRGASCTGALFLFNPTARALPLELPLDASLGCSPPARGTARSPAAAGAAPLLLLLQIGSSDRSEPRAAGAAGWARQLLRPGDSVRLTVPPSTALVLSLEPWQGGAGGGGRTGVATARPLAAPALAPPLLLGASAAAVTLDAAGSLALSAVAAEAGTAADLTVVLPRGAPAVRAVTLNGAPVAFAPVPAAAPPLYGAQPAVSIRGTWAGARFGRAQEIGAEQSARFAGGTWRGGFVVPPAALRQLEARNASYRMAYDTDPDGNNEANVPWLAPGRLLVWAKYAPPLDDAFNATGEVDGAPLIVRKAYNTIVPSKARFIGYWADVTALVKPGAAQTLTLQLPPAAALQGVHFENVETLLSTDGVLLQAKGEGEEAHVEA